MGKQSWELLERRTLLAAAGDLDSAFNSTGIVTQQFDNVTINKLAIQSDSKIVIVGAIGAGPSGSTPGTRDFFLARFNADGSLDHSFGTNNTGTVQTDFGGDDIANDIAIDAVGRIVVAGGGSPGPSAGADFAIARYTSDGKLDTTFNGTGKRLIDFGADEQAIALVVSTNNKITLAGEKPDAHAAPIARLNPDGSLDNSFSTDGIDQLSFCARVSDLALDPSGRIVLAAQFLAGGTTVEALAASWTTARLTPPSAPAASPRRAAARKTRSPSPHRPTMSSSFPRSAPSTFCRRGRATLSATMARSCSPSGFPEIARRQSNRSSRRPTCASSLAPPARSPRRKTAAATVSTPR
jgi:uncharacterized delta-60 repeat protein